MSDELLPKVQEWLEDEDYEEVLEALEGNEDPAMIRYRVDAMIGLEQYQEALEQLQEICSDPRSPGKDPEPWNQRGLIYYYLDEMDDAQLSYTTALKIDPAYIQSYIGRALVYREIEFERAAQLDLERCLMLLEDINAESEDDEKRLEKAEVYDKMAGFALDDEKPEEAEQHFKAAAEIYAEDGSYTLELARLLSLQGRLEEALAYCKTAIEADELLLEARLLLSYIQGTMGQSEEAIATANAAIDLDDEEPYSYLQLSSSLIVATRYKEAIAAADKAISLDDEVPDGYQLKAAALQSMGRTAEITPQMQTHMEEVADLPTFLYGDRFDPYDEAARIMDEMQSMDPNEIQQLAGELFSSGQLPEALRPMMEQVLQNLPAIMDKLPAMMQNMDPNMMAQMMDPNMMAQMMQMGNQAPQGGENRPPLQVIKGGKEGEE